MDISQICTLLRQLGLETSIDEEGPGPGIPPSFVAESNNSLIDLRSTDDGMVRLSYLAFEEEEARFVLKNCPSIIQSWYKKLDHLVEEGDFQQIPFFFDIFTPDQAYDICFHLGSRMTNQGAQSQYSL